MGDIRTTLKLARAFSEEVQAAFSAREFREVCDRNKSGGIYDDDMCCATHEFCDANMLMLAAFQKAFGRNPLPDEGEMSEADTTLWNDAWAVAKAAEFFA